MKSTACRLRWITLVVLSSLTIGAVAASDTPTPLPGTYHNETNRMAYSLPFANLDMAQMRAFVMGNRTFNLRWAVAPGSARDVDGLGPTFAQHSCSSCHLRDGRSRLPEAGGAAIAQAVIKISPKHPRDSAWLQEHFGDALQAHAIANVPAEATAQVHWQEAQHASVGNRQVTLQRPQVRISAALDRRLTKRAHFDALVAPAVFGLGLLENVDAQTVLSLTDPDDRDHDDISGRAHWIDKNGKPVLGRFGWKASATSLREQITTAAWADMGLTSADHPLENCPSKQSQCRAAVTGEDVDLSDRAIQALETYLRVLAVPSARTEQSPQAQRGRALFHRFQCAACHRETLQTGSGSSIALLNNQSIRPYTDLLLHDLGPELADHRHVGNAEPNEWRTPPLWGLGLLHTVNDHQRLLHDGRANGIEEAILWHGGEAANSRERYRTANEQQRVDLLEFLRAL